MACQSLAMIFVCIYFAFIAECLRSRAGILRRCATLFWATLKGSIFQIHSRSLLSGEYFQWSHSSLPHSDNAIQYWPALILLLFFLTWNAADHGHRRRADESVCHMFLSFWPMMYKAFVLSPITFDVLMVNPTSFIIDARSSGEKE